MLGMFLLGRFVLWKRTVRAQAWAVLLLDLFLLVLWSATGAGSFWP
jgi:hypothetical protein